MSPRLIPFLGNGSFDQKVFCMLGLVMVTSLIWAQPSGKLPLLPAEIYPFIPFETLTADSTSSLQQLEERPPEEEAGSPWHFGLARAYQRLGRLIEAARHARLAVELQPEAPHYRLILASIYCRMELYDLAQNVLGEVLSGQKPASEGRILLAYLLQQTGQREASLGLLQEVLNSDPQNPYALYLAGAFYFQSNRPEEALKDLRRAAAAGLDLEKLHFYMGRIYARDAVTFEQAIKAFHRADRSDGVSSELKKELGLVYYRTGRYQEALEELEEAVQLQPEYPQAFHIMAQVYQRVNRLEEAGRALARYQELAQQQSVRERNLRRGQISYQEGLAQLSEKRLDEASKSFQESLELLPEKDASYYALANIHYLRQECAQAMELVGRAIEGNPLIADYYILLAECRDKEGDILSAVESMQKALLLSPRRPRLSNYLGNLCFKWADYKCAADAYRVASELEPDNRFYRMNLDSALSRLEPQERKE